MTRRLKNSGVKWIGDIPENWEVIKMRNIGTFSSSGIDKKINENEPLVKIINYTDVYRNNTFILKNNDYMVVSTTEDKIKKHNVNEGDLIFTPSSETIEDIGVSALVNEPLINTAFSYHVLRFQFNREVNKEYKKYLCNNIYVQNVFSSRATGSIRKTLSRNAMKDLAVFLPPIKEQQKIAEFLDHKVLQINLIIENAKLSIGELKKYKHSLITETVTKGLNKNIEMKDTGNDWIGEIPQSWKYLKTKYIFNIKKIIAKELGHDILSVTQKGLKVKDISKNEGQIAADYSKYQFVNVGDFVMNHMDLLTGWVDCSNFDGVTSPDYRVFKFIDVTNYSSNYYKYIFQMCYFNKIYYGLGQGVSNLGRWRLQTDKFLNFVLPVPTLKEQNEIVFFLDDKCNHINILIEQNEKLISELETYKKTLIYECVTGKREVL